MNKLNGNFQFCIVVNALDQKCKHGICVVLANICYAGKYSTLVW